MREEVRLSRAVHERNTQAFERAEERFERSEERFERMMAAFDRSEQRFEGFEERLDRFEASIDERHEESKLFMRESNLSVEAFGGDDDLIPLGLNEHCALGGLGRGQAIE